MVFLSLTTVDKTYSYWPQVATLIALGTESSTIAPKVSSNFKQLNFTQYTKRIFHSYLGMVRTLVRPGTFSRSLWMFTDVHPKIYPKPWSKISSVPRISGDHPQVKLKLLRSMVKTVTSWGFPSHGGTPSSLDGLFHEQSQSKMDDLGVPLF